MKSGHEKFIERRRQAEKLGGRVLGWYLVIASVGLIVLAVSCTAQAQTPCPTGAVPGDSARICWTNAILNEDGSSIPPSGPAALKETRIARSLCNADGSFGALIESVTVTPDVGVVLFSALPPGRHCFRARHANNANDPGAWSGTVSKTTTAPAPPKPRQPNVTIA